MRGETQPPQREKNTAKEGAHMHNPALARFRAAAHLMRGRFVAASAVILAAAVVCTAVNHAMPAEALETVPENPVPLTAVALQGAAVDSSATNLTALNTAAHSDIISSGYTASLPMYGTLQLQSFAVQDWQGAPYTVAYASSDESICTVDASGLVTGIAAGSAVVTATAADALGNAAAAVCSVTVTYAEPPLESIALNRTKVTLRMGGTGTNLTVSCTPESYASVMAAPVYSSSDESICTVDADGHVTAVAPGEATVTAAVGTLNAACTVTVKDTETVSTGGIALLNFDMSSISAIGNQTAGRCSWYALRYARTILDGSVCSGSGMWGNGVIWSAGGYSDYSSDLSSCLSKIYSELSAGRPVIVHLQNTYVGDGNKHANRVTSNEYWWTGSGWNEVFYPHIATSAYYGHWVCIVGCSDGADPNNLKESDFYALDPARVTDGSGICVTRLLDGTLWIGNSPLKVAG